MFAVAKTIANSCSRSGARVGLQRARVGRFAAGVIVVVSKTSLKIKRIRYREAETAYISVFLCCITCTVKALVRARHGSLHATVCC